MMTRRLRIEQNREDEREDKKNGGCKIALSKQPQIIYIVNYI